MMQTSVLFHCKYAQSWQRILFFLATIVVFVTNMIAFPMADQLYSLYFNNNTYFDSANSANISQTSLDNIQSWQSTHIARFSGCAICWVLSVLIVL